MAQDAMDKRVDRIEQAISLLTKLHEPKPKPWWKKLPVEAIKDVLYIIGLPVTLFIAYEGFDKYFISAEAKRLSDQREAAIARLDQLQEINSEIYQLQSAGSGNRAFAIIEAKRGQIARLTDTVFQTWQEQPDMLSRFDLNALAEALLVQKRTDNALAVAETVKIEDLAPIDAIDQAILKARIQFELGPAHDMEAARDHLRATVPLIDKIERQGNKLLMQEKVLNVRLINELWRGVDCTLLQPMAEGLAEVHMLNKEAGAYEDRFGVALTLATVNNYCN